MDELEKNVKKNLETMYDLIATSKDYSNSVIESKKMIFALRSSIVKNRETIQINKSKAIVNS